MQIGSDYTRAFLTWDEVAAASKYEVQYSFNGSSWYSDGEISAIGFAATHLFTSSGYSQYDTVYFKVRAYNSNGWGPFSSTVSVILW
jgi:hypothetical protein